MATVVVRQLTVISCLHRCRLDDWQGHGACVGGDADAGLVGAVHSCYWEHGVVEDDNGIAVAGSGHSVVGEIRKLALAPLY